MSTLDTLLVLIYIFLNPFTKHTDHQQLQHELRLATQVQKHNALQFLLGYFLPDVLILGRVLWTDGIAAAVFVYLVVYLVGRKTRHLATATVERDGGLTVLVGRRRR
ncbi:hypothetical protein QBC40DRAFT_255912 [Triangularia verruculosa]|uniref:Uncharacterized protein n=1 Tax=Triangularia verruculosa TaxID=2587418 RepID=A0AAN6XIZ7_9PEZI|nr:hypothetical protein QBC40DRAFT_255912 [Triangularia verruculosa]